MKIWKIAAVAALALSSFAAENVAPTKTELEEMYNKAFREFDANNFPQALKELDAIDARQPDLAASQNLRGVILMRQGIYDKAEVALLEAERIDPKFWNARFNLAEIPFLKKDWAEARKRFEKLLSSSQSDLASEASQLIQYKILLTYLLEGKENMVDSILAKLELSPDTPAVDYVKAAVAFQHKNGKEAKDWTAAAEKNFSPQLNKLFAESLYEVGWLEKPTGQARASLPLTTAAERSEKTKAVARSKFEQAQQALRQRDFTTAVKLVDEADQAEPNQPSTLNLRGEILMQQKQFDQAEAAFKRAAKLDPKFREAQYNLAQIPFKNKDYAKARERFETLFKQTPGGDKNQAAQLIKFKIYMTLLLEGKESRAQAIMEQFQFTGDTPALYYAQAAWEFKHNNPEKAADWTASAKRIYSPALNSVFADAFYDVGWMQGPEIAAAPASALDTASVIASQPEGGPAIEPSPIPDMVVGANNRAEKSKDESLALSAPAANPPIAQMEATSPGATAEQPSVPASNQTVATGTSGKSAAPVSGSTVESAASAAPAEAVSASPARQNEQPVPARAQVSGAPPTATSPAAVLAPARIAEGSPVRVGGIVSRQTLLFGGLLLAGIFLLAWVVIPKLRRYIFNTQGYWQAGSLARPGNLEANVAHGEKETALRSQLFGGPRQVSLQLTALRQTALSLAGPSGAFDGLADLREKAFKAPAYQKAEADRQALLEAKPVFRASAGSVVAQTAEVSWPSISPAQTFGEMPAVAQVGAKSAVEPVGEPQVETIDQEQPIPPVPEPAPTFGEMPVVAQVGAKSAVEPVGKPQVETIDQEQPIPPVPEPAPTFGEMPAVAQVGAKSAVEPVGEPQVEAMDQEQPIPPVPEPAPTFGEMPAVAQVGATSAVEPVGEPQVEAIDQEQPIPQVPEPAPTFGEMPVVAQVGATSAVEPVGEPQVEAIDQEQPIPQMPEPAPTFGEMPAVAEVGAKSVVEPVGEPQVEAIDQEQPIPQMPEPAETLGQMPVVAEGPFYSPNAISNEPVSSRTITPVIMPQQPEPTEVPAAADMPRYAPAAHTAVQLTFSFEIVSIQLTPAFKVRAVQVRPASKIVTMRLAPSQRPQPDMHPPVTFEIAEIQSADSGLGTVRLIKSPHQQQQPVAIASPSFEVTALHPVSSSDAAVGVQLAPSEQGQTHVQVTADFQMAKVEFSSSFEITGVVLNSTSRHVSVQLAGADPSAIEEAPVFDIANGRLTGTGGGEILELDAVGTTPEES